jgi:hypothetical protein
VVVFVGFGGRLGCLDIEQGPGLGEVLGALPVGEQAVVAYPVEALGQDMQEEAADELVGGERHSLVTAFLRGAVVLALKGDVMLIEGDETGVGDGDPMGIAREVSQHGFGSRKRPLGIDDPLELAHRLEPIGEGLGVGQHRVLTEERQFAGLMGVAELLKKETPEQPRAHPHGQEEAGSTGDSTLAIEREAAAGHDTVHVWVVSQRGAPGVQHQGHADASAELFRVGGKGEQGLGGSLEQQAVNHRLVVLGQLAEGGRQREGHRVVLDRQQLGLALGEPGFCQRPLTLGAVAIAAGNGARPITCLMGSAW